MLDDVIAWQLTQPTSRWIYDKLLLSSRLGYQCAPAGVRVPRPGRYCVRPITNLQGMGRGARFEHLVDTTAHLEPGSFWCEIFLGQHLSVDYAYGRQVLAVEGVRELGAPLYQWSRWQVVDVEVPLPEVLREFASAPLLNCEYIGGHLIEAHLRHNPDFAYNNTWAVPVWNDQTLDPPPNSRFVEAPDYYRLGFYVNNKQT